MNITNVKANNNNSNATANIPLLQEQQAYGAMNSIAAGIGRSAANGEPRQSDFRRVFQTSDEMKTEFVKFLQTIFYQLDERKVLAEMEKLLADPNKIDEEIYNELLAKIGGMKKWSAPIRRLWSLSVLKKGMGEQSAELMRKFQKDKFHDYMEIYDRRYHDVTRKHAKLPLDGKVVAVCDSSEVNFGSRIQAGSVFSRFPYKTHVPLNDADCKDPLQDPEHTHKPIGNEVDDASIDLISCLGGLHHIPASRVDAFAESMSKKLRPGAVMLMRDHNVGDAVGPAKLAKEDLRAIASVVHTFVNAEAGVKWEVENKEIREFKSMDEWTALLEKHQFMRVSPKVLVLKNDPTENGMSIFVKKPQNLAELSQATQYVNNGTRPKDGTRATWIEWGNVRSSKQYAEFIQSNHSYAFDHIGHLRQHWRYFFSYLKESRNDDVSLKNLVFSDNFAMNLFILLSVSIQAPTGFAASLPSRAVARLRHGAEWRTVTNLSDMEKFDAKMEKEYSEFIDHTPFYMFSYVGKIKELWGVVAHSKESYFTRVANIATAAVGTVGLVAKAAVSAPVRAIYTSQSNVEPDTVTMLVKDPNNELQAVISQWEREKNAANDAHNNIEVIYTTPDGHKLVTVPRYRPFTKICGYIAQTDSLEILEVGGQKGISVDVLLKQNVQTPSVNGARVVYEMDKLQDKEHRRYVTYHVAVNALKSLQQQVGVGNIEYIHE